VTILLKVEDDDGAAELNGGTMVATTDADDVDVATTETDVDVETATEEEAEATAEVVAARAALQSAWAAVRTSIAWAPQAVTTQVVAAAWIAA